MPPKRSTRKATPKKRVAKPKTHKMDELDVSPARPARRAPKKTTRRVPLRERLPNHPPPPLPKSRVPLRERLPNHPPPPLPERKKGGRPKGSTLTKDDGYFKNLLVKYHLTASEGSLNKMARAKERESLDLGLLKESLELIEKLYYPRGIKRPDGSYKKMRKIPTGAVDYILEELNYT